MPDSWKSEPCTPPEPTPLVPNPSPAPRLWITPPSTPEQGDVPADPLEPPVEPAAPPVDPPEPTVPPTPPVVPPAPTVVPPAPTVVPPAPTVVPLEPPFAPVAPVPPLEAPPVPPLPAPLPPVASVPPLPPVDPSESTARPPQAMTKRPAIQRKLFRMTVNVRIPKTPPTHRIAMSVRARAIQLSEIRADNSRAFSVTDNRGTGWHTVGHTRWRNSAPLAHMGSRGSHKRRRGSQAPGSRIG